METELLSKITLLIKKLDSGIAVNWQSFLLFTVVAFFAAYFGSYIRRKGQDLATKEDVADITKEIEQVKTTYAKQIEIFSHHNRLRIAAIDRRLEAYQEAFTLWSRLRRKVHKNDSEKIPMVQECQIWWEENCIYLDDESREAFISAIHAVALHSDLTGGKADRKEVEDNWAIINQCGKALTKGAGLPSFGKDEIDKLDEIEKLTSKK